MWILDGEINKPNHKTCFNFFILLIGFYPLWTTDWKLKILTGARQIEKRGKQASVGQLEKWVRFSSVAQLRPTLCNPMDCSTPGLSVHHQLLELTQTHVRRVSDAIQPSHTLSSPSLPALNLSQHQGLFQRVSSSHQMAKILELQLQDQSFQCYSGLISFRMDWMDLPAVQRTIKSLLQYPSLKHQFFSTQLSL